MQILIKKARKKFTRLSERPTSVKLLAGDVGLHRSQARMPHSHRSSAAVYVDQRFTATHAIARRRRRCGGRGEDAAEEGNKWSSSSCMFEEIDGVDLGEDMFIRKLKEERMMERQRSWEEFQELLARGVQCVCVESLALLHASTSFNSAFADACSSSFYFSILNRGVSMCFESRNGHRNFCWGWHLWMVMPNVPFLMRNNGSMLNPNDTVLPFVFWFSVIGTWWDLKFYRLSFLKWFSVITTWWDLLMTWCVMVDESAWLGPRVNVESLRSAELIVEVGHTLKTKR